MYVEFVHVISMSVSEYIILPSRQGWRNGSGGAGDARPLPPPEALIFASTNPQYDNRLFIE